MQIYLLHILNISIQNVLNTMPWKQIFVILVNAKVLQYRSHIDRSKKRHLKTTEKILVTFLKIRSLHQLREMSHLTKYSTKMKLICFVNDIIMDGVRRHWGAVTNQFVLKIVTRWAESTVLCLYSRRQIH